MSFVDDIRSALAADPRTQKAVAQAAGIHPVHLSRFATGERGLGAGKLESLAQVLGLSVVVTTSAGAKKSRKNPD